MTTTARNALTPSEGMVIYNSTTKRVEWYNGSHWMAAGNTGVVIDQDGASSATAALSCKNIYDAGQSTGDALYWLDPDGSGSAYAPFQAYCDMTNGGWTLITRMISTTAASAHEVATAVGTLTSPTQGAVAKLSDAIINAIASNNATPVYKINCNSRVNFYKLPSAFSATQTTWNPIQVSTDGTTYYSVNAGYPSCSKGPHSCDQSSPSSWGANGGRSPAALYGAEGGFLNTMGCSYTDNAAQQSAWSAGSGTAWVK
jgi:hypothetical protein